MEGPYATPRHSLLASIRRLFRKLPVEPCVRVIVTGPPDSVAQIQASLEAAEPRLSLGKSVGMIGGDDSGGRVLMYWSLDVQRGAALLSRLED